MYTYYELQFYPLSTTDTQCRLFLLNVFGGSLSNAAFLTKNEKENKEEQMQVEVERL